MKVTRMDESEKSILPSTIKVPFPDEAYEELLHNLGYKDKEKLQLKDYRKIFVNAVYLFLKGSWSQDNLSSVANRLWFSKEDKFDEFGYALYECAELTFYVRNIYNPLNPEYRGNFDEFMVNTIKFYEKYFDEVVVEEESESKVAEAKKKFEKLGLRKNK